MTSSAPMSSASASRHQNVIPCRIHRTPFVEPILIRMGDSEDIKVGVTGIPTPQVKFYLGDREIQEDGGEGAGLFRITRLRYVHTLTILKATYDLNDVSIFVVASNGVNRDRLDLDIKIYRVLPGARFSPKRRHQTWRAPESMVMQRRRKVHMDRKGQSLCSLGSIPNLPGRPPSSLQDQSADDVFHIDQNTSGTSHPGTSAYLDDSTISPAYDSSFQEDQPGLSKSEEGLDRPRPRQYGRRGRRPLSQSPSRQAVGNPPRSASEDVFERQSSSLGSYYQRSTRSSRQRDSGFESERDSLKYRTLSSTDDAHKELDELKSSPFSYQSLPPNTITVAPVLEYRPGKMEPPTKTQQTDAKPKKKSKKSRSKSVDALNFDTQLQTYEIPETSPERQPSSSAYHDVGAYEDGLKENQPPSETKTRKAKKVKRSTASAHDLSVEPDNGIGSDKPVKKRSKKSKSLTSLSKEHEHSPDRDSSPGRLRKKRGSKKDKPTGDHKLEDVSVSDKNEIGTSHIIEPIDPRVTPDTKTKKKKKKTKSTSTLESEPAFYSMDTLDQPVHTDVGLHGIGDPHHGSLDALDDKTTEKKTRKKKEISKSKSAEDPSPDVPEFSRSMDALNALQQGSPHSDPRLPPCGDHYGVKPEKPKKKKSRSKSVDALHPKKKSHSTTDAVEHGSDTPEEKKVKKKKSRSKSVDALEACILDMSMGDNSELSTEPSSPVKRLKKKIKKKRLLSKGDADAGDTDSSYPDSTVGMETRKEIESHSIPPVPDDDLLSKTNCDEQGSIDPNFSPIVDSESKVRKEGTKHKKKDSLKKAKSKKQKEKPHISDADMVQDNITSDMNSQPIENSIYETNIDDVDIENTDLSPVHYLRRPMETSLDDLTSDVYQKRSLATSIDDVIQVMEAHSPEFKHSTPNKTEEVVGPVETCIDDFSDDDGPVSVGCTVNSKDTAGDIGNVLLENNADKPGMDEHVLSTIAGGLLGLDTEHRESMIKETKIVPGNKEVPDPDNIVIETEVATKKNKKKKSRNSSVDSLLSVGDHSVYDTQKENQCVAEDEIPKRKKKKTKTDLSLGSIASVDDNCMKTIEPLSINSVAKESDPDMNENFHFVQSEDKKVKKKKKMDKEKETTLERTKNKKSRSLSASKEADEKKQDERASKDEYNLDEQPLQQFLSTKEKDTELISLEEIKTSKKRKDSTEKKKHSFHDSNLEVVENTMSPDRDEIHTPKKEKKKQRDRSIDSHTNTHGEEECTEPLRSKEKDKHDEKSKEEQDLYVNNILSVGSDIEPSTKKMKKKKRRDSSVDSSVPVGTEEESSVPTTPKRSKEKHERKEKKGRDSSVDSILSADNVQDSSPKKAKKKKQRDASVDSFVSVGTEEESSMPSTPKQKSRKKRDSSVDNILSADNEQDSSAKKAKKKKIRDASVDSFVSLGTEDESSVSTTPKKSKEKHEKKEKKGQDPSVDSILSDNNEKYSSPKKTKKKKVPTATLR